VDNNASSSAPYDEPPPEDAPVVQGIGAPYDEPDPNAPPEPSYYQNFQAEQNPSRGSQLKRTPEFLYGAGESAATSFSKDVQEGGQELTRAPDRSDIDPTKTWESPTSFSGVAHDIGNVMPVYGNLPQGIKNRLWGAGQVAGAPMQVPREALAHGLDAGIHAATSLASPEAASQQVPDTARHPHPSTELDSGKPHGLHAGSSVLADLIMLGLGARSGAGTAAELSGVKGAAEATRMPLAPRTTKAEVPTGEQSLAAAQRGFDQAENLGANFNPTKVIQMINDARMRLSQKFSPVDPQADKTYAILDTLENHAMKGRVNFKDVNTSINQILSLSEKEPDASWLATHALDDHLIHQPRLIDTGSAADAQKGKELADIIEKARGNYAGYSRTRTLESLEKLARSKAQSDSPVPEDVTMRRGASKILDPQYPSRTKGFSEPELRALEKVRGGSFAGKAGSLVESIAPGLGAGKITPDVLHAIHAFISPWTGIPGAAASYAAGKGSEALKSRAFQNALDLVRSRSPLAQEMAAKNPPRPTGGLYAPTGAMAASASDLARRMAREGRSGE
jgi:hypothetical protein